MTTYFQPNLLAIKHLLPALSGYRLLNDNDFNLAIIFSHVSVFFINMVAFWRWNKCQLMSCNVFSFTGTKCEKYISILEVLSFFQLLKPYHWNTLLLLLYAIRNRRSFLNTERLKGRFKEEIFSYKQKDII